MPGQQQTFLVQDNVLNNKVHDNQYALTRENVWYCVQDVGGKLLSVYVLQMQMKNTVSDLK